MADLTVVAPIVEEEAPSVWREFWFSFCENRGAVLGLIVTTLIIIIALGADFLSPHSPLEQFRDAVKAPPFWEAGGSMRFPLGTDGLGRDMLSRLIYGARVSLFIGISVMSVSFALGVLLGLTAAFEGSFVDVAISRVMDVIIAVPSLVLAILIVAVLGPGLFDTILAVTIVYLPRYVRLARGTALGELGKDYVVAARTIGVGKLRLMFRTVLPNCMAPLIVLAALGVSDAILEAAALGFLGLGAQPPTPEWGSMLADSRGFIRSNPWIVTFPGLAILITVVAINLFGDGLRDALDPEIAAKLMALLEIRNLGVTFKTRAGPFQAVEAIDLSVDTNEIVAIVGESGSGKSVAMLAVMGLLPWTATVTATRLEFAGHDLLTISRSERRKLIGRAIAMIFQEPMTSLNPCFTVGFQVGEVLRKHLGLSRAASRRRTVELFEQVGLSDPEKRLRSFPHQLSGGMNQRVMIAMALACGPQLLIADEPTTALDVTIQAQILDLLLALRRDTGMALVLITHDMGIVAETADRVTVQYAGRQVEMNSTAELFADPHHPYTAALLAALPERATGRRLPAMEGMVPGFVRPPACLFEPRCHFAFEACRTIAPVPAAPSLGRALCHIPLVAGIPTRPHLDEKVRHAANAT